jgi:putative transposase
MAKVLGVSESGYHQWKKRQNRPKTDKEKAKEDLTRDILNIYLDSNCVYGGRKISKELSRQYHKTVNHKAVEKILKEQGIVSKVTKKYKATTNSKHDLPVYENILDRDFIAMKPSEKMVSDITYISTVR